MNDDQNAIGWHRLCAADRWEIVETQLRVWERL